MKRTAGDWWHWVVAVVLAGVAFFGILGVGDSVDSHVAYGVRVLVAAVVLVGVTRGRRWGCAAVLVLANAGMWGCFVAGTGFLHGWNHVPPTEGVVVDRETGEGIAGARVWRWWVRDEVGWAILSPGGINHGYPSEAVSCETDGRGRFELPGLWALHAAVGMGFAAYAPGYEVGWYQGGVEGRTAHPGNGAGVKAQLESKRLRVEIRLARLDGLDPRQWERHLRLLEYGTEYGYPLPKDLLLDEAYRYVSEGGELTEGILSALDHRLPLGPPLDGPWKGERIRVIGRAVLKYCLAHPEGSQFCSRRPFLIENYAKGLGLPDAGRER